MSKVTHRVSALIALTSALAIAVAVGTTGATAQSCLDKWEIQEAVSSGQIRSLDAVLAGAGVDASHSVLNVQVCDQGGQLVYVIGVLTPAGDARNLVLGAN